MTDDIVTRLREETCPMPECCWLFADAADEIERLRAEVDRWITIAEQAHYMWRVGASPWVTFGDMVEAIGDEYEEEIRDGI